MPLDSSGTSEIQSADGGAVARRAPPTVMSGADIGQALKAVRQYQALTLDEVAEFTRVRATYLAAIEEMRLELLPSRPFTIGYIRAYASALGLDPDLAADRFRNDEPVLDEPLHAPLGVQDARDPRFTSLVAGACVIVAAIFLWNIGRRAMVDNAPPPAAASNIAAAKALAETKPGPIALGAPLPAPVESTTPPPYETPGLADATVRDDGALTLGGIPKPLDQVTDPPPVAQLPPAFVAKGTVYGAKPQERSSVTVQALRSASLIVRGADGSLYFARQLAPGEAFRAPQLDGLTLNVTDPNAFQVFVGGQSKGVLPAAQASVSGLAGG
jgi:transcriptional regulator with XRE-family HTH domain